LLRYVQIIIGLLFPKLTEEERLYGWFQKDSATAHAARVSMQALSDVFGDRIIVSGVWPARSPDPNPCDFFFWGCLNDKVYNNNPRTEDELKENIRREIAIIPAEQLQSESQDLFRRHEKSLRVE
jgi:inhibitor of nuclear factor kappa-B kinase subunit alpha